LFVVFGDFACFGDWTIVEKAQLKITKQKIIMYTDSTEEPELLTSLVRLIARYGTNEVMEAISIVEVYVSTASFDDVSPVRVEDTKARKGMYLVDLENGRFGIFDEKAGNLLEGSSDRKSALARLVELRRGRGDYVDS